MQLDFNKYVNYVILKNHKYYAYFNSNHGKRHKFFQCKKTEIPNEFISYDVGIIKVFYNSILFKEKKIINNKDYLIFNDNSKVRGEMKIEKTVTEKRKNREKKAEEKIKRRTPNIKKRNNVNNTTNSKQKEINLKDKGIILIMFGFDYEKVALNLVKTVRKFSDINIEIHTNLPDLTR